MMMTPARLTSKPHLTNASSGARKAKFLSFTSAARAPADARR